MKIIGQSQKKLKTLARSEQGNKNDFEKKKEKKKRDLNIKIKRISKKNK